MTNTDHVCTRCGNKYDWQSIDPPENATIYWVPKCPDCNTDMTATTVDLTWLHILSSDLDANNNNYERYRHRLHAHSRLYHGRLTELTADELIDRAQWFDERVSHGNDGGQNTTGTLPLPFESKLKNNSNQISNPTFDTEELDNSSRSQLQRFQTPLSHPTAVRNPPPITRVDLHLREDRPGFLWLAQLVQRPNP